MIKMDRAEASEKIKSHCAFIAKEMMHVNPVVNALDDELLAVLLAADEHGRAERTFPMQRISS